MKFKRIICFIILFVLVTLTVYADNSFAFTDVAEDHWAKDNIYYFYNKGIVNGYEDGSFKPDNSVSRDEFCKLLSVSFDLSTENLDKTNFLDVKTEHWAYPYIQACYKYLGYSKSNYSQTFSPSKPATREEVAAALVRIIEYDLLSDLKQTETLYFNDSKLLTHHFYLM